MTEISTHRDRIVVGVDGSEPSKAALQWARYLAEATGSSLLAVMAWQPYPVYGGATAVEWVAPPPDSDIKDAAQAGLEETLDEVLGDARPTGLETAVVGGNPTEVLIEMSEEAQMLVLGSRGRGGFKGLLLGSVSSACVHHATCPVFLTHGTTPPPAKD